jgi:hypothetical protein
LSLERGACVGVAATHSRPGVGILFPPKTPTRGWRAAWR